jgi:hypothetical protein
MNLTKEMLDKAKTAKSAAELLSMAKENNIEITEAQAIEYYAKLHGESGELADEELEEAAGGYQVAASIYAGTCEYCRKEYPYIEDHIKEVHPEKYAEWYAKNYSC